MSILAGGLANLRWGGQASGADGGPGGQPQGQTLVNDYELLQDARQELKLKLQQDEVDTKKERLSPQGENVQKYYVGPYAQDVWGYQFDYRSFKPFPQSIIADFEQLQCMSFQGLFPDIHRAWVTVDNRLHIWDYTKDEAVTLIDDLEQLIIAVALVRPSPSVFKEQVKYLVVVATTLEVIIYAATFSNNVPDGNLSIRRTSFTVSTDGVIVTKIVGTRLGRIFMSGRDGYLYEVAYCNEDVGLSQYLGLARKCHKVNVSSNALTSSIRPILQRLGFQSPTTLIDAVVDDYRGLVYTLSTLGVVQLFDLGESGLSTAKVGEVQPVPIDKEDPKNRLISLHVIPPTESRLYHLVGVTTAGFRYYFQTSNMSLGRPRHLVCADNKRAPPDPAVWQEAERDIRPAPFEWKTYKPDYTKNSQSARTDYHQAYYRHGVLLMAEGVDDRAGDKVVIFGEDASAKAGEVVTFLSAQCRDSMHGDNTLPGIGRVRAIAEETEIIFPANNTALDRFRYQLATSGTPPDQNQEHTWACRFNKMVYQSFGTLETPHIHTEYGALLSEAITQLYSSRVFLLLSSRGLHIVTMNRPVDILWRLLYNRSPESNAKIELFRDNFKEDKHVATLLMITCNLPGPSRVITSYDGTMDDGADRMEEDETYYPQPSASLTAPLVDIGFPVGRGQAILPMEGYPKVAQTAADHLTSFHARQSRQMQPVPTQAQGGMGMGVAPVYGGLGAVQSQQMSDVVNGLQLFVSRVVRPVWYKPLVVQKGEGVTAPRFFLREEEILTVLRPLERFKHVLTSIYREATTRNIYRQQRQEQLFPGVPQQQQLQQHQQQYPAMLTAPPYSNALVPRPAQGFAGTAGPLPVGSYSEEDKAVHKLFRLVSRTIQALKLLNHITKYVEQYASIVPILEAFSIIQDLGFWDMVTSQEGYRVMKGYLTTVIQQRPEAAQYLVHDLTRDCFYYYSSSDLLMHQAGLAIKEAKERPAESSERADKRREAVMCLRQAAPSWRTQQQVQTFANTMALDLLRLGPVLDLDVIDAIVDTALLSAQNFGGAVYRPDDAGWDIIQAQEERQRISEMAAQYRPWEYDLYPPARRDMQGGEQERATCFQVIAHCLEWLLKETSRIPPISQTWDWGRLTQDDADKAAKPLLIRALKSQDPDFHELIYETLFKLEDKGLAWLKGVTTPYIKDFLRRKTEDTEEIGLRQNFLQGYLEHHGRYGEAVDMLESMVMRDRLRLDIRIHHLNAGIVCLTKGLASGSSDVTLQYQQAASRLESLQDQLQLAQLQQAILHELRTVAAESEEERRVLDEKCVELENVFFMPNQLFRLTKKYTRWELALRLIDVCNTEQNQTDTKTAVEGLWRNIIYNSLPVEPQGHNLRLLREAKLRTQVLPRRGQHQVGRVDLVHDEDYVLELIQSPNGGLRRMARELDLMRRNAESVSFPVRFLCRELEEVEACLDRDLRKMEHRTWKIMNVEGLGYYDLFRVYLDILTTAERETPTVGTERDRRLSLQLHTLSSLDDILSAWMNDLKNGHQVGPRGEPLLDARQQMHVVKQLEKLSQWSRGGANDPDYTSRLRAIQTNLSERGEAFKRFVWNAGY